MSSKSIQKTVTPSPARRRRSAGTAPQNYPHYADAVKRLLGGRPQQVLADKLQVSQTQVSAWARGAEKPSAEALIKMANLASSPDDRYFFWLNSGIDVKKLENTVWKQVSLKRGPSELGAFASAPLVENFQVVNGKIEAGDKLGAVSLPAAYFTHPVSLTCLRYERRNLELPQSQDLLVIDDFEIEPQSLRHKMIAVYFSPFPIDLERDQHYVLLRRQDARVTYREPQRLDVESARLQASQQAEYLKELGPEMWTPKGDPDSSQQNALLRALTRPGVLAGWLKVQFASGEASAEWRPKGDRWRLTLHIEGPDNPTGSFEPLTEWQEDDLDIQNNYSTPLAGRLRKGVWIVGAIAAWIAQPFTSADSLQKEGDL